MSRSIIGKINLLIVAHHLDKGGVEEIILTYTRLLPQEKYNITVACLVAGQISHEIATTTPARVIHIDTSSRVMRFFRMWKIARQTRAQIVHNHACWYGLIAGLLVGAKRVETVHNIYHWFKQRERIFYGLYCRLANQLIAVSEHVRRFTIEFFPFIKPQNFVVIYNGIDYKKFLEDSRSTGLRRELGIRFEEVIIGFVGRLTEQKGIEYLLEAAERLSKNYRDIRIVLVGDGERRQQLEHQAASLGLSSVMFAGYQRDIPRFFEMFDIFVLPSLWEGLPVSVLEAMAAARPVVATRISGTQEVVEEGVTGYLVEPRNVQQLEDRLAALIANADLRKKMGEAGRQRVIERFSAETMIAKTDQLYDELLTRS